jgi:hypothetical protein
MKRGWVSGLLVCGVLVATAAPAAAGDPGRYEDRASWPRWAATYFRENSITPIDGELVDAIRFELIRGYPVEAQDYMGYEDRTFAPGQAMTRAEFAAVLSRSQGLASEDGTGAGWFLPYVEALRAEGIIPVGASEAWGEPISRREAGQWMGRAAEAFGAHDRENAMVFTDVDDPLVLRALRAGIVKGTGEGRFEPDRALLRVEAAVMLVRLARARNAEGNAQDAEVIETLKGIVLEADRQATERDKHWVEIGFADRVELAGIRTQEFADYLLFMARDALEVRQTKPFSWTVTHDNTFEVLEAHDTVATLLVCGAATVYRAESPEVPWFEQDYCERQFMVRRGESWVIAAADDPPLGE